MVEGKNQRHDREQECLQRIDRPSWYGREVRKIDPPFFFAFVGMRLEDKRVDAIHFSQKSLMILPIMLICDFGVQPKERREKRVLRVGGINVN